MGAINAVDNGHNGIYAYFLGSLWPKTTPSANRVDRSAKIHTSVSPPAASRALSRLLRCPMPIERFDWTLVRSLLAVLDAGRLMGAARKLGAQQPTLSRHIAQLGGALFERTGRGVTATSLGLSIAEPACHMAAGADSLSRALAGQRSATSGTVRVSTSEVAAVYLLPPIIAQLRLAEPGIAIELVAANGVTNLLRREADIAVRMLRPEQSSLVARKLGEIELVAAAHSSYPARAGWPRTPADWAQHQLIGYDVDDTILRGFAAAGLPLTRGSFCLRTDNQLACGRLLAGGAGIGFVARYNLAHWPGVVPLLPGLGIPSLPCWLAVHRENRANPVVRRVYDFLGEAIAQAIAK